MVRTIAASCLVLILLATAARAAEPEDYRIVASPAELARADHDGALAALAGVIERDPGSPAAAAALIRMQRIRGFARDEEPVTDRLLAVVRAGAANGENDEALRRYLYERLRERGDFEAADALAPDRGYVLDWAVLGPFGFEAESLIDRRYEPEEVLDFAKGYRDGTEVRRFFTLPRDDDRTIDPFDVLEGRGVAYAVAQVRANGPRAALMKVVAAGSLRVWVNGAEVMRLDRVRERRPQTIRQRIDLGEGWNRIVVKATGGRGRFSMKLSGMGGESYRPIEFEAETGLALHAAAPATGTVDRAPPVAPGPAVPALGGAFARAVEAILLDADGLDLEAVEALEAAVVETPGDPGLRMLLGETLESANGLPEVWRKNRAKAEYQEALALDPDHSPAIVALALRKHADDRSEEAAADLRALLEQDPTDLTARWAFAQVASGRGWEKEALDAAGKCLEIAPRFRPARLHVAGHHDRYQNVAAAKETLTTLVGHWHDDFETLRRLARMDVAAGDVEAAIARQKEISRLYPSYTGSQAEIAGLLVSADRTKEALGILVAIAAERPLSAFWPRRIGEVHQQAGNRDAAVACFRQSLDLNPAQHDLRRRLERMTGETPDFSLPWETEVLDLIPDAPGREEFPRAPAVCLLDQTVLRVWTDGSMSSITHMAYKLLDEKGVEKFGRVTTGGETLEVRTIDPAGKIWEPIGLSGSSFNMPALAPGAVVEYRYREDAGTSPRAFDTGGFYFADPDYGNAVLLSRWIVILPKGFEADLLLRQFEGEHTVEEDGDSVVHVFEAKNSPRTEKEPFMPGRDDLLPWARFLRNRPFDDIGWMHADRFFRGLAPTPLVRRTALEIAPDRDQGPIEAARALWAYVNDHVTGDSSFGGPTATILEKAGDRFSLYASLLIARGIEFEAGMACPDRARDVDFDVTDPGVFDRRCLRITGPDGHAAWAFDSARFAPFGRIPDDYRDSPVLVLGTTGARIESLPPEPDGLHENLTRAQIRLGDDPAATRATVTLDYRTDGGYGFKERARRFDADEKRQTIEGWLASTYTGPAVEAFDFPDLETPGVPAVLTATARLPNFLRPENDTFVCGLGMGPLSLSGSYVGKPTRIHPMDVRTDYGQEDRTVLTWGGGWRLAAIPEDHVTVGPLGTYSLTFAASGDELVVTRRVRFRPVRLSRDEYPVLVKWVKAIDEAEARKIRFARR